MVGERTGRTFKLGEKAKIRVKDVDMMLKNIDFELVEDDDYEQSEKTDGIKLIANNKKARHDYFVEDSFEAGIVLHGTEVKSLRQGHCSIKESFVDIDNGKCSFIECISALMKKGNIFNKDPLRTRKLLLHKSEISKMIGQINQKGYTLIPLKVYFSGSLVKVQIGLCKGKKLYDKRQDISKGDQLREAQRDFKVRNFG